MKILFSALALVLGGAAVAQQPGQPSLKIEPTNRTLALSATDGVSVEPEVAILHIGFETAPTDAKSAYAAGSRKSNAIMDALKQAGVEESDIRSVSQYLSPDYTYPKQHRYTLTQQWTVRCTPARAAELLDIAVDAGATSSGEIDWTVKDEKALADQALNRTTARLRESAETLAHGMGVKLGVLLYTSNEVTSRFMPAPMTAQFAFKAKADNTAPLAVAPQKVSREATVYAVFTIE